VEKISAFSFANLIDKYGHAEVTVDPAYASTACTTPIENPNLGLCRVDYSSFGPVGRVAVIFTLDLYPVNHDIDYDFRLATDQEQIFGVDRKAAEIYVLDTEENILITLRLCRLSKARLRFPMFGVIDEDYASLGATNQ